MEGQLALPPWRATVPQRHMGIASHCLPPPGCEGEGLEGVRGQSSRVAWAACSRTGTPTVDIVGLG